MADPTAPGQIPCLADRHRRDVERPHVQASVGQPDSAESLAAGEIESVSGGREGVRVGRKNGGWRHRTDGRWSLARVPRIPAEAVLHGHTRQPRTFPGRSHPDSFSGQLSVFVGRTYPFGVHRTRRQGQSKGVKPCFMTTLSTSISYTGLVSREVAPPVTALAGAGGARRSDRRPRQTIRKVLDAGLAELRE